ncbi:MAG: Ppx/GppA family phosphatase [Nitrospirae bacterium]|nr:Ppx/GppA family phosphatase [Nitrospirota bacterium]MBI3605824.1 Ppx/GppA family phosphatase [Nitrospirota bacterium]
MVLAGIDIGTNTLRLLIVEEKNGKWKEIFSDRRMTRLGEGFFKTGCLSSAAIEKTVAVLNSFQESLKKFQCQHVLAVATSAVREAENRQRFLSRVKEASGLEVSVISGDEEARLTFLGISSAVSPSAGCQMMIDIGGGSTEWILGLQQQILAKKSARLGVVFLTEQYLFSDPPSPDELHLMKEKIRETLLEIRDSSGEVLRKNPPATWIGTAGTITTLAAMAQNLEQYSFEKVNGFVLTREMVQGLYRSLISKPKEERKKMKGLEPGREDIIVAGALILLETMAFFNFDRMVVSDYGLREGIILELIQQINLTK